MDTIIFMVLFVTTYFIVKEKPKGKVLALWALCFVLVVILLRVHITSSLGLGLTW